MEGRRGVSITNLSLNCHCRCCDFYHLAWNWIRHDFPVRLWALLRGEAQWNRGAATVATVATGLVSNWSFGAADFVGNLRIKPPGKTYNFQFYGEGIFSNALRQHYYVPPGKCPVSCDGEWLPWVHGSLRTCLTQSHASAKSEEKWCL